MESQISIAYAVLLERYAKFHTDALIKAQEAASVETREFYKAEADRYWRKMGEARKKLRDD